MPSIERSVKQQFARVFTASDWRLFKRMAEFYLRQAAFLRTSHLNVPADLKLVARNSQKRLFIGVGVELLLKAVYLKRGYVINKPQPGKATPKLLSTFAQTKGLPLAEDRTFTLDELIAQLRKVVQLDNIQSVLRGLRIAKVFRNKEGHTVAARHAFDPQNYRDIESALSTLYRHEFGQTLTVRFSVARSEKPLWRIASLR